MVWNRAQVHHFAGSKMAARAARFEGPAGNCSCSACILHIHVNKGRMAALAHPCASRHRCIHAHCPSQILPNLKIHLTLSFSRSQNCPASLAEKGVLLTSPDDFSFSILWVMVGAPNKKWSLCFDPIDRIYRPPFWSPR